MFAILLSEKMDPFYQIIGSFPTVIWTILLVVLVVYWLGAVIGLIDIDIIDLDLDSLDLDGADMNPDTTHSTPDVLAGLLLRFGLVGVPVTVSLTILVLVAWLISYYSVYLLFGLLPLGFLKYPIGLVLLFATLYLSALATGFLIRPIRPLFAKATQETIKQVLGQTAVVRTSRVDNDFGEAALDDGGAGLILKVRTTGDDRFAKGDRVVIYEKISEENIYRVISEEEFVGR